MATEMTDCCCNQEAELNDHAPLHGVGVLTPITVMPDISLVVSEVEAERFVSSQNYRLPSGRDRGGSLRAPPDLYLLHATFLI